MLITPGTNHQKASKPTSLHSDKEIRIFSDKEIRKFHKEIRIFCIQNFSYQQRDLIFEIFLRFSIQLFGADFV